MNDRPGGARSLPGRSRLQDHDILGVPVCAVDAEELSDYVFAAGGDAATVVVGNLNLHGLYLHLRDAGMQEFYRHVDVVHADGMPIIWIGKLLGYPLSREHRVTYVDWLPMLLARAERERRRVLLLGGPADRAAETERTVRERYPELRFKVVHGYFSWDDEEVLAAEIERWDPDLLFVGMGMPRQEQWIVRNHQRLPGCAVMDCGAAFDYLAGHVPVPPRFLGRLGLEWLFRLLTEPRRLAGRYLIEPWAIVPAVVRAILSRRR